MAWEWLAPGAVAVGAGASFLGARLGARANREASSEATTQRELQARRDEWGRRFTAALDRTGSSEPARQRVGLIMMRALLMSSLATDDDRRLARIVHAAFADPPQDLEFGPVDDANVVVDDGQRRGGDPQ